MTEGYNPYQARWETEESAGMTGVNQALSYIVLERDRAMFEAEFPNLRIAHQAPIANHLRYLLSGGLNFRQLVPDVFDRPLRGLEALLLPLGRWAAWSMDRVAPRDCARAALMLRGVPFYLIGQVLAYGVDADSFVLMHSIVGTDVIFANLVAKAAAGSSAFFHREVTFRTDFRLPLRQQAARYTVLLAANGLGTSALLWLLLLLGGPSVLTKVVSDIIFVGATFLVTHSFVFAQDRSNAG